MPITNSNIEQREQRIKMKKSLRVKETETSNKLLSKNLANTNNICKRVDAVYVMGKTITERLGQNQKRKEMMQTKELMSQRDNHNMQSKWQHGFPVNCIEGKSNETQTKRKNYYGKEKLKEKSQNPLKWDKSCKTEGEMTRRAAT